jgi:TPP-dependent trihydroxycyclohexane-1,2-dione (THcHDO) dehydratase
MALLLEAAKSWWMGLRCLSGLDYVIVGWLFHDDVRRDLTCSEGQILIILITIRVGSICPLSGETVGTRYAVMNGRPAARRLSTLDVWAHLPVTWLQCPAATHHQPDGPGSKSALAEAKKQEKTTVIYIETDRYTGVPGYESWWDVAVAEVSENEQVKEARQNYEKAVQKERFFL